jgi:hypothetical protein
MRIMVTYDPDGNITKAARVYHLPEDLPHPFADLSEEHRVLSLEKPSEELQETDLSVIRNKYRVDVEKEELVPP